MDAFLWLFWGFLICGVVNQAVSVAIDIFKAREVASEIMATVGALYSFIAALFYIIYKIWG